MNTVRVGDRFQLEDGVWVVTGLAGAYVDLQCKEQHAMIRYPRRTIMTWKRLASQLVGDL